MGAQLRAVRRRIKTVQSTAKITRAQELIASSRVLKAQQRVRDATPYARELVRALEAVVSRSSSVDHPLVNEVAEPSRAAVLIMTSDRGFAGGFNAGSTGVALIGSFDSSPVPGATYSALRSLLDWKLAYHHVDPMGTTVIDAWLHSLHELKSKEIWEIPTWVCRPG
jgi:F-type H+-transporting ATPase subunit gamma